MDYETALKRFLTLVTERDKAHMAANYPTLHTNSFYNIRGTRYDKIVRDDGERSKGGRVDGESLDLVPERRTELRQHLQSA